MVSTVADTRDEPGAAAIDPVLTERSHDSMLSDLPMLALVPVTSTNAVPSDIFDDAIFGEDIDISDLISALSATAPSHAVNSSQVTEIDAEPARGEDFEAVGMFTTAHFTVLFEDDTSSGHGTL